MPSGHTGAVPAMATVRPSRTPRLKPVESSWGEPERADLTFSVAKTYLALLAGVARMQGLLPGEDEPMTDGWTVKEELDHVVDVVIDSGECGTEPTTVVDFSSGAAEVVRVGSGDPSRFE